MGDGAAEHYGRRRIDRGYGKEACNNGPEAAVEFRALAHDIHSVPQIRVRDIGCHINSCHENYGDGALISLANN
jgi:hypothetical protein